MEKKKYITRIEASEIFGVCPQTISNWMEKGLLIGEKTSHSSLIDYQSIEKLISSFGDIAEVEKNIEAYKAERHELEKEYKQLTQNLKSRNWVYRYVFQKTDVLVRLFNNAYDKLSQNKDERTTDIIRMFLEGRTFQEIGNKYGLYAENIERLLRKGIYQLQYADSYDDLMKKNEHLLDVNIKLSTENTLLTEKMRIIGEREKYIMEILHHRIDNCSLPTRISQSLLNANILTLGELAQYSRQNIHKLRNIGEESLKELDELLAANHLEWGTPYEFGRMKKR